MNSKSKTTTPNLMSLKRIFEETSEHTGQAYFRSLVQNLAEVLQVHGVWVTRYLEKENRLQALAFWLEDRFVEKYEYDVKGTPCEPVLDSREVCHVPQRVIELYPEDPDLRPMGAVSYMGLALRDHDGRVLGHLALLDQKPMEEIPEVFVIFKLFAARAGAELRRMQYENRLEEGEVKLRRLIDGTMDAILEVNSEFKIVQANETACSTFQAEKGDLEGAPIKEYLTDTGYQKILKIIPEFDIDGKSVSALWLEGFLECRRSGGRIFMADATMSCYRSRDQLFFALFIRDVTDRIEKEEKIQNLTREKNLLEEQFLEGLMGDIVGQSEAIQHTLLKVEQVAPTDSTVLILGETGTGKELIAREIFKRSTRKEQAFITLNCAALPSELIESELFGHVKGAFTGATSDREGRFSLADRGTIFLDEIGELPLGLQAKLLRVIQEGEYEIVGTSRTRRVDVRIIAATHKDLKTEAGKRNFREDLYYRLNVFPITIPPLRERDQDVIQLAEFFRKKYASRHGRKSDPLSLAEKEQLLNYAWPGNVRELQNVMERSVITGKPVMIDTMFEYHSDYGVESNNANNTGVPHSDRILTSTDLRDIEIRNLKNALAKTNGKIFGEKGAAALVGIPPTTFCSKMKKYGI